MGVTAALGRLQALALVLVLCTTVFVVALQGAAAAGWGGRTEAGAAELLGAADFNSISGKSTIFWGEENNIGRYPPEYAAQLKQMRRLMHRVKLNNDR